MTFATEYKGSSLFSEPNTSVLYKTECVCVVVQVCLAWPVGAFPSRKVGLTKSTQTSLRVKPGNGVFLHPVTGPILQAEDIELSLW